MRQWRPTGITVRCSRDDQRLQTPQSGEFILAELLEMLGDVHQIRTRPTGSSDLSVGYAHRTHAQNATR